MNNYYNNEENERNKLINDLKRLPKIDVPDDFEFNLMTRIQNRNFTTATKETPRFNLVKFLAPSAVVVTAILLFLIFYPKDQEITNLNISKSPITTSSPAQTVKENSDIAANDGAHNLSTNNLNLHTRITQNPAEQKSEAPKSLNSNTNNVDQLIHDQNSIALDDYISGGNSNEKSLRRGSVVTSEDQVPDFDGFFVKQKTDPATLKRYREVVDSLKKAQMKLDSLKKASKLP